VRVLSAQHLWGVGRALPVGHPASLCALPALRLRAGDPSGIREAAETERHVQATLHFDDHELSPEVEVTLLVTLDVLFDSGLMDELEGELPEWIDLSALIPEVPPEDWPDPRR